MRSPNLRHMVGRISEEKQPARFLMSRLLWRTGLCRLLTIRRPDYRLRFYPTAYSAQMWAHPDAPNSDEDFFRRYLRAGHVVIDVGANVGTLALTASTLVGCGGHVYAIEAHPATFRYLLGNVRFNRASNVTPLNLAAGREQALVRLSEGASDDQNAVASDGSHAGVQVQQKPLDDLDVREEIVDLLKIDVEGYEKHVLEGATALLRRTRCVLFESFVENYRRFGYGLGDVLDILEPAGFTVHRFQGDAIVPVGREYASLECENLLALKDIHALGN